ncbi:hypothetical protein E4U43_000766 [Claviceps pusilla]|uniref:PMU1-high copy suppressor of ts tps2 mutant phenotype n=1 Tax=Claviceps pusilla TaxID=123648 RepID=A0A9P7NBD2_9HYPO|nr:hypothetical protein E4U43_000766 [Claviceps pusilla]
MSDKVKKQRWEFQAIPGFFASHTEIAQQCADGRFVTQPNLALLSQEYPTDTAKPSSSDVRDWKRFAHYVRCLNRDAPSHTVYKVLYLTRHGCGYHNQKHAEVGTEAWNEHRSLLDGDGDSAWFDSFLNEIGIQSVKELGQFWLDAVQNDGLPIPQTLYTSPLARRLQTTDHVFSRPMEVHRPPFQPIVKEHLRERFTMHICDLRRPRSWIEKNYPGYKIEDNVTERDALSCQTREETDEEHCARKQQALEEVFSTDNNNNNNISISLTIHSFAISAILRVCHGEPFKVREGTSLALLVRGEMMQ